MNTGSLKKEVGVGVSDFSRVSDFSLSDDIYIYNAPNIPHHI